MSLGVPAVLGIQTERLLLGMALALAIGVIFYLGILPKRCSTSRLPRSR